MPSRSSAFSSTQRIARSSSTIQTGFCAVAPRACCGYSFIVIRSFRHAGAALERQEDREHGASRPAFALDRAAVLRDERLREGKPEPAAAFAARHEWIEDAVADRF